MRWLVVTVVPLALAVVALGLTAVEQVHGLRAERTAWYLCGELHGKREVLEQLGMQPLLLSSEVEASCSAARARAYEERT